MAATATIVASDSTPNVGDSFYVTVSGAGFPDMAGATLGLSWNSEVVSVAAVALTADSPFADLLADAPLDVITILAPLAGTPPSGSFEAFRITFTAVAKGDAAIRIIDDGDALSWSDADGNPVDVTYTQPDIEVRTPLPPTGWLLASSLALLARFRRRNRSTAILARPLAVN